MFSYPPGASMGALRAPSHAPKSTYIRLITGTRQSLDAAGCPRCSP